MNEEPDEPVIEVTADDGVSAADLSRAYVRLNEGLANSMGAAAMQPFIEQFRETIGHQADIARIAKSLTPTYDLPDLRVNLPHDAFDSQPPPVPIDLHSPTAAIAESTAEVADLMNRQHEAIAQLVALTAANVQHTESQREIAERTEKFTRGMAWASLIVSGASLIAAVAAIVVSIATAGS
ncbi:hypothetical protein AB0230_06970 [Microbacterium sp. NPDC089190]|uniref:hypothetical protein n=1 Tax=Microbacterium sp. NPDC089190 TaxID=3155063 RepID=UPI00344ED346